MSSQVEPTAPSVKFLQYHQPALADGEYEITVTQTVQIDAANVSSFTDTKYFTVAGERFDLKPVDVHGVFPPDGNLGEHSKVLPHIILNRSTLPWERTAEKYARGEQEQVTGVPWLALLLFDEAEIPKQQTLTLRQLRTAAAGIKFPDIELETGQHPDDSVTVIDVPHGLLKAIMPPVDELKLLAHVRFGTNGKDEPPKGELAIIIASRLPRRGKTSTAHLVSIEGRLAKGQAGRGPNEYDFDYDKADGNDVIRLVTLKSWSFACEEHDKDFKQLLLGLNESTGKRSTLRLPESVPAAEKLFARGFVPLPHYFRRGNQTASWFHGPLIPGRNTSPEMGLPARVADELVRYDRALSMFDVSYAAAWELGRLLALQDKAFSTSLYQWKREHAQQRAQNKQRLTHSHLPFQKETPADLPNDVASWFASLRKLEGVPFNYLVPDERMLPAESIRFFRMDQAWVDCLADGAFSIGRVASSDHQQDKLLGDNSPAASAAETITGFLLRSEVVSGWPGLLVEAFSDKEGKVLRTCRRMERLSAGVLLCLFEGEVARVEIHLKAETLHFGLDGDGASFSKKLRDPKSGLRNDKVVELKSGHWRDASKRILNVAEVALSIKEKLELQATLTSAQFALQMVEGVEKIIFVGKP